MRHEMKQDATKESRLKTCDPREDTTGATRRDTVQGGMGWGAWGWADATRLNMTERYADLFSEIIHPDRAADA